MKLIILTLLLSQAANAQFNKFKSSTKFKPKSKTSKSTQSSAMILTKPIVNTKSDSYFGRENSPSSFEKISKDKRYVNLNPETAFGPEIVKNFDFRNTNLMDLTKHMQKLTGINLILDKELKGKITIMAPTAITVGDAWKAYLTALNINGYSLVKSGSFYKVVSKRDIRYTPTKIYTGSYTPSTENYVMTIIPLKYINADEVVRSFRPFTTRYGRITPIRQTNTIIIQDTGKNINRLTSLIKTVDVPGHEQVLQIIPVKNSSAQEIATLLGKILKSTGKTKRRTGTAGTSNKTNSAQIGKIIAEPRTNTIIAMANSLGATQLITLIKKLDVKGVSSHGSQIHVHYLNYGDAEALSKTLQSLINGSSVKKGKSRFSRLASSKSSDSLFSAQVKITADKDNNALVVTASPTDYLTIKKVIRKLDIPRDQVYVEGMIMETNITHANGFGLSFLGAYGTGAAERIGFSGGKSDLANLLTGQIASLGGFFAGGGGGPKRNLPIGPGGADVEVSTINGLINAVATNTKTNVLATPQILALDNTEATFEIGETIPVPKTSTTNGTVQTSTEQQKVSLKLKIKPQINKVTRFIKLTIDQSLEDFSSRSLPSGLQSAGLATNTRSAVTTVVVRDQDTIAMGGLMRDKESIKVTKVPLLGDIPVLGWLFKNKEKTVEKINLLFFLTPRILANYQRDNSVNVQDLLKRRQAHLKESIDDDNDPFETTVKGLYKKARNQKDGPLYDVEEASRYLKANEESGIGSNINKEEDDTSDNVKTHTPPNYQEIYNKVKSSKE